MAKIRLLNPDAQLNNFYEINQIEYVAGENVPIVIQLLNDQIDLRRIAPITAIIEVKFLQASDGLFLTKTATLLDPLDRSIWVTQLTSTESLDLASGNIQVEEDVLGDDTNVRIAIFYQALARQIFDGDC